MGTSNYSSDDTTFLIVLVIFAVVILLGLPFCMWIYLDTVEQRIMIEATAKKVEKLRREIVEERKSGLTKGAEE
jgi:uncharacterized membrane protein YqjE